MIERSPEQRAQPALGQPFGERIHGRDAVEVDEQFRGVAGVRGAALEDFRFGMIDDAGLDGKALPDTKNVVGTNVIEIAWRLDPRTGRLIVLSAEDNLVKGASGQAVQSMNILCGFPETAGLI